MGRVTIGGGNTRVGEVYLDALFRQRALEQEQNRVNMQARIEQQRIMRDAADQEMRARESALQRAQQLQMARESQAFNARESAAQRAFDADKLAQMQAFEEEKMGKQTEAEKNRLELMDKLERERWEAQNDKIRQQKDADYVREELSKAKAEAAKIGVKLDKNATLEDVYSGLATKANELDKKKDQDTVWRVAAGLGAVDESMPDEWKRMASAVKKEKDLLRKSEHAKTGVLPESDPIFDEYPELREMNNDAKERRLEEFKLKKQAAIGNQMVIEQKAEEQISREKQRRREAIINASKNTARNPEQIEAKLEESDAEVESTYGAQLRKKMAKISGESYDETPTPTQTTQPERSTSLVSGAKQSAAALFAGMPKELAQEQMDKVGSVYQNTLYGRFQNPIGNAADRISTYTNPIYAPFRVLQSQTRASTDTARTEAERAARQALYESGYRGSELAQELERQRVQTSQPWLGSFMRWISGDVQPKYYQ